MVSKYVIYKYTSPSGKSYIGQTCDLDRREIQHRKTNCCRAFASAIKKYGFENFTKEILEENLTIEEANNKEAYWIEFYNTISPNGYNLMLGGNSCEKTIEHKEKIGMAREEWFKTDEGIEWKNNLSERLKNKQIYERHPLLGVKMSQSTKDKMSETKSVGDYILISPNNEIIEINNIAKFCKDKDVNSGNLFNVANGKLNHTLGWVCFYRKDYEMFYSIDELINYCELRRKRKQSDRQKSIAKKIFSKTWILISPDGIEYEVDDLKEFSRLHNIKSYRNFSSVASGKLKHCNGWLASIKKEPEGSF